MAAALPIGKGTEPGLQACLAVKLPAGPHGVHMARRDQACEAVIEGLENIGLDYFIHIPDSVGAPIIDHFQNNPDVRCFSVAREEEGIGVAGGLSLDARRGCCCIRTWVSATRSLR